MTPTLTTLVRLLHQVPDMTLTQAGTLFALNAGFRTLAELSDLLGKSDTLVGLAVAKLIQLDLAQKTLNLNDRRKLTVTITPQGQALVQYTSEE